MKALFLDNVPLIDVRADVEFSQGAFPSARNLPILNDEERRLVGICYKENGAAAAEKYGYELVSGASREKRIDQWLQFIEENPGAQLYCFRGGKRSQIATKWISEAGKDIARIPGGYKSLRRYLLDQFEALPKLMVVSGKTGVGKTVLLSKVEKSLDLEQRANHRGSAFGGKIDGQPTQINFENSVAIDLLRCKENRNIDAPLDVMLVEDESRLIGRIQLPVPLQEKMNASPIVLLEDSLENRVMRIYDEYIIQQWAEYENHFGGDAQDEFSNYLCNAIDAIRKRLGGAGHKLVRTVLDQALLNQQSSNFEMHQEWIKLLLEDYYDPMYSYQLEKKKERIVYRGSLENILEWTHSTESAAHG